MTQPSPHEGAPLRPANLAPDLPSGSTSGSEKSEPAPLPEVRDQFLRHVTRVVAAAVRACQDAHGRVDPGSVGKRVAAQMWGQTEPSAWNQDLGQWVRHVRGQLGMSQIAFAAALGTKQDVVSRWEQGAHKPGPSYQAKIKELARASPP